MGGMIPLRPFLLAVLSGLLLSCDDTARAENAPESASTLVQSDTYPALACYQRARDRTTLSPYDAFVLCRGAASVAPATCYEQATSALVLSYQALALCRCATTTAPIDCFLQAQSSTTLAQPQIIELCAATVTERLYADCTPVR